MSILDPEHQLDRGTNNIKRLCALKDNPYRGEMSMTEYARYLDIYARVAESYAKFFEDFWYRDDVEMTNEKMTEELVRTEVFTSGYIWTGLTEEENKPLGEYVLALDCPVTTDAMQEFFRRVMMGDLEFRCRYPMDGTTAQKLIRENIDQKFWLKSRP